MLPITKCHLRKDTPSTGPGRGEHYGHKTAGLSYGEITASNHSHETGGSGFPDQQQELNIKLLPTGTVPKHEPAALWQQTPVDAAWQGDRYLGLTAEGPAGVKGGDGSPTSAAPGKTATPAAGAALHSRRCLPQPAAMASSA